MSHLRRGVLKWARTYHGGGNISADEMKQFEEKFTTETNNEFKNRPQNVGKQAKRDMKVIRASVASGCSTQ